MRALLRFPRLELLAVLVLALAGFALALSRAAHAAAESPPSSAATATTESLGAVTRTDGWAVGVTTTAVSAWTSAPSRITSAQRAKVRFVRVRHCDDTDTSTDVCFRLGGSIAGADFACNRSEDASGVMSDKGDGIELTLARDFTDGSVLALNLVAASGTVDVCVDVGW